MKKLVLLTIPLLSYGQVQIGQDVDGEAAADNSGNSVSISSDGGAVAIGAPFNDGNGEDSGHVRVFSLDISSLSKGLYLLDITTSLRRGVEKLLVD